MYKSSYAHFHSKVFLASFRALLNPRTLLFQATEDTFLLLRLKTYMEEGIQPWPNKVSTSKNWAEIPSDCQPLASIWTETL